MEEGSDPESFDEFPDCVYWFRQFVSLVIGVTWGLTGITGAAGIIGWGAVSTAGAYWYYTKYAAVDEDAFGRGELLKEGLQPSFGVFMLFWIVTYTMCFHSDAPAAAAAAAAAAAGAAGGGGK